METIAVKDDLKELYINLVRSAQQMEQQIGAADYRLYKLKKQREQVDIDLKTWWDTVAEEYKLDKTQDYYVDNDGNINQVERPAQPAQPAEPVEPVVDKDSAPAEEPKPAEPEAPSADPTVGGTVEDLK